MKIKWQYGIFLGVIICIIVITLVYSQMCIHPSSTGETSLSSVCTGENFIYISKNYSNPITYEEIDSYKQTINSHYTNKTKNKIFIGGGGGYGLGGGGPEKNVTAKIVIWGYYIDPDGGPHEWISYTTDQNGMDVALKKGLEWYDKIIYHYPELKNISCTRYDSSIRT